MPEDQEVVIPSIPKGFATKLGTIGAMLLAAAAVLTPLLPNTGASTSKVLIACSTVLAAMVVFGRMLQAAALVLNGPGQMTVRPFTKGIPDPPEGGVYDETGERRALDRIDKGEWGAPVSEGQAYAGDEPPSPPPSSS